MQSPSALQSRLKNMALVGLLSGSLVFTPVASAMDFSSQAALYNSMSINAGYHLLSKNTMSYYDGSRKKGSKKSTSTKSTKTAKSTQSTKQSAPKHNSSHYRYKHSNSVSNQVTSEFISHFENSLRQQGKLNSQAQNQLNELKNMNLIGQVKKALKSDGYQTDSVATAMAAWIVVNYGVATDQNLAHLKGHTLVKQLEQSMGGEDSVLIGKSDAEKQQIADYLYWMTIVMMLTQADAQQTGNHALLKDLRQQAKTALSNMGLSTSMLTVKGGDVRLYS